MVLLFEPQKAAKLRAMAEGLWTVSAAGPACAVRHAP